MKKNSAPHRSVVYLVIGSGRMASHLVSYFNQLNLETIRSSRKNYFYFNQWNRKQPLELLEYLLDNSTHVLLAISDSSIQPFYETYLKDRPHKVIHFAGSLFFDHIPCAHPLMTFGPRSYDLEEYKKINFVLTQPYKLSDLLPGLKNPEVQIPIEKKAYYHALCVIGGNFTTLVTKKMIAEFEELGIPLSASKFYLDKTLANVYTSPSNALTGPLARKDKVTVSKNLKALEEQKDPYLKIYKSFIELLYNEYFLEK